MGFLSRGRRQDNRNNFNLSFNPAILNLRPTKCYVAQKVSDSLSQYKKNIIFQKNIKFSTSNYCVRDDKLCAVPTRLHADFDKYDYLFGISILEFLSFFNLLCIHRQWNYDVSTCGPLNISKISMCSKFEKYWVWQV